jgi:hypothetical protein
MSPIAAHKMVLIYCHDDFALHHCQAKLVHSSPAILPRYLDSINTTRYDVLRHPMTLAGGFSGYAGRQAR